MLPNENLQVTTILTANGTSVTDENPMPTTNPIIGALDDAAVEDPATETATMVALMKGLLAQIVDLNTNLTALNAAIGEIDDAAVTNPASNASVIAALKGVVTNTAGA